MPNDLNHANITFIPKVGHLEMVKELRPISLCNVMYEIIVEVLTNHIKSVLPTLIHEMQSAFVHEKMITSDAIVAFEVFHKLKNK